MHLSVISEPRRGASPRRSCLLPGPCRHRGDAALLVSPLCWISQSYQDKVGLRHRLILLLLPSALPGWGGGGGGSSPPRPTPAPAPRAVQELWFWGVSCVWGSPAPSPWPRGWSRGWGALVAVAPSRRGLGSSGVLGAPHPQAGDLPCRALLSPWGAASPEQLREQCFH